MMRLAQRLAINSPILQRSFSTVNTSQSFQNSLQIAPSFLSFNILKLNQINPFFFQQIRPFSYNQLPLVVNNPQDISRISLHTIRDSRGAKKKKVRVGRGPGSGVGKTSGKGHKGAGQRTGSEKPFSFEGGQTPFYRRIRKYGFRNGAFQKRLDIVRIDKLQQWIDNGRIDPRQPISVKVLKDSGLASKVKHGVKIIGGKPAEIQDFRWKVRIEANAISESAKNLIEKNGGTVRVRHFPRVTLRRHLKFGLTPKYSRHPKYQPHYLGRNSLTSHISIREEIRPKIEALTAAQKAAN